MISDTSKVLKTHKSEYRVVVGMMQRDEENRLEAWILYHSYLFGIQNLYIFDNGSTSKIALRLLEKYERCGLQVNYNCAGEKAFSSKGTILADKFQELEDKDSNINFFFPMDCDEFLLLKDSAGQLHLERETIYLHLDSLILDPHILVINEAYPNILGHPGFFFKAYSHHKVFFARGTCKSMSEGFHTAVSRKEEGERDTNFVYLHFNHRPFCDMVQQSERKLKHYVDVLDIEKLKSYQGPGAHVVRFLMNSQQSYLDLFEPEKGIHIPVVQQLLKIVDMDKAFLASI